MENLYMFECYDVNINYNNFSPIIIHAVVRFAAYVSLKVISRGRNFIFVYPFFTTTVMVSFLLCILCVNLIKIFCLNKFLRVCIGKIHKYFALEFFLSNSLFKFFLLFEFFLWGLREEKIKTQKLIGGREKTFFFLDKTQKMRKKNFSCGLHLRNDFHECK